MRSLLVLLLAAVAVAATASAATVPGALPEPDRALLLALGLMGLGAGLSKTPRR